MSIHTRNYYYEERINFSLPQIFKIIYKKNYIKIETKILQRVDYIILYLECISKSSSKSYFGD